MGHRTTSLAAIATALLLVTACSDSDPEPEATDETSTTTVAEVATTAAPDAGDPVGIVAIGHSGLTGQSSVEVGEDAPENSWATGDAPEVTSIYQRLVAAAPENEGHVSNKAVDGSKANRLESEISSALNEVPHPLLVIIQTIDNDITCDGADADHVEGFGRDIAAALQIITDASPDTQILIVGYLGRPQAYADALAGDPAGVETESGDGACDLFDSSGQPSAEHIATLTEIVEGYEAEQVRVCATVEQCHDDGGALGTYVDAPDGLSGDHAHLSVAGHRALAEHMWPVVAEVLGLA